jgi:hypothetical protein
VATKASQAEAKAIMVASKGKTSLEHAAKLKDLQKLSKSLKTAKRLEDGFEKLEGTLGVIEGIDTMADGDAYGAVGIGTGLMDIAGVGGPAGDVANIGHNLVGAIGGAEDAFSGTGGADPVPVESPKDWPGLDSSGPQ